MGDVNVVCPHCGDAFDVQNELIDPTVDLSTLPGWLDWVIVGGESGPAARPFDIAWARSTILQCSAAGVACFVKQLGDVALWDGSGLVANNPPRGSHTVFYGDREMQQINLSRKGGSPVEWPEDLRVREFPKGKVAP